MATTHPNLQAVLDGAQRVLARRQDGMLTTEEWVGLARAVAACTGATTASLLTDRDLEDAAAAPALPWDEATDGPLATSE
jgi:hypothetical protein